MLNGTLTWISPVAEIIVESAMKDLHHDSGDYGVALEEKPSVVPPPTTVVERDQRSLVRRHHLPGLNGFSSLDDDDRLHDNRDYGMHEERWTRREEYAPRPQRTHSRRYEENSYYDPLSHHNGHTNNDYFDVIPPDDNRRNYAYEDNLRSHFEGRRASNHGDISDDAQDFPHDAQVSLSPRNRSRPSCYDYMHTRRPFEEGDYYDDDSERIYLEEAEWANRQNRDHGVHMSPVRNAPRSLPPPCPFPRHHNENASDDSVHHVHHDSPAGPAVSLYPKGTDWRSHQEVLERRFSESEVLHQETAAMPNDIHEERIGAEEEAMHHPNIPTGRLSPCRSLDRSESSRASSRVHSARKPRTLRVSFAAADELEDVARSPPARPSVHYSVKDDDSSSYEQKLNAKIAGYAPIPRASTPSSYSKTMVEISPGVSVPLRGVAEIKECIKIDFFLPFKCFCCDQEMFHIQDCTYVICPTCRTVLPVLQSDVETEDAQSSGVGLGFTIEDLGRIQQELFG